SEDEREEELSSIKAIYQDELAIDPQSPFQASIQLLVAPTTPLLVVFAPPVDGTPPTTLPTGLISSHISQKAATDPPKPDVCNLSYLPPLHLQITLPEGYPSEKAPQFRLSTSPPWLPLNILQNLQDEGLSLWEEYGRGPVLFSYITYLQEAAERGFDILNSQGGMLAVSQEMKIALLDFDIKTKRKKFEQETFECGICLEPKKGSTCFRLPRCSHVFCVPCLQDFYNNCIAEGDVNGVKCLSPDCGKDRGPRSVHAPGKKKSESLLTPNELLQIPLEKRVVQRYVEMRRKKKLESDKSTIYCPRKWCQGAARSKKYPKIVDITQIIDFDDSGSEDEGAAPEAAEKDRLAICEDCSYAFCRVCLAGWHGEFVRCWPRDATELSAEEQASYNYILAHTSPCPTCSVPCQKTHGCNHMSCFQCKSHFCYLCSSWLDANNPYEHFNQSEKPCYMRLWEMEEGDDGDDHVRFDGIRARAPENQPVVGVVAERVARVDLAAEDGGNVGAVLPPAPDPPAAPILAGAAPHLPHPQHVARREIVDGAHMVRLVRGLRGDGGAIALREEPNQIGLQRFLQMVQDDEEDEWDSDELDED
ncbi:RWD-domain-containing protein, partial [Glonium stellatum]